MNTNTSWFKLIALGIAAAIPLTAAATTGDEDEVRVISKTVVVRGDAPPVAVFADSCTIEVRIENGEISVKVDGKEIPSDKIIRHDDGRIVILDEDGNEISLFGTVVGDDDDAWGFTLRGGPWGKGPWGPQPRLFKADEPQPKVMLGIHLAEPGKALEQHLKLEPGTATMISGLYEGLPAHDAGLDQFDIIVAVDGNRPADPQSIHKALAGKQPGDTVTLTVIHEGQTGEVVVTLKAFDAQKMGSAPLIGQGPSLEIERDFRLPMPSFDPRDFVVDPDVPRLFRMLERPTRKSLEDFTDLLRERAPRELDERLDQLNDRIDELKQMLDKLVEEARALHKGPEQEE